MKFLQHIYHYINNKANEYWVTLFVGFAFYFFLSLIGEAIHNGQHWSMYHLDIFIISFLIFLSILFNAKPQPLLFIIIILIERILGLDDWIGGISDWTFFQSPIRHLFDTVTAKDSNVFLLFCFMIIAIMAIIKIIYLKIKTKKWDLKSIFTCITIFSFIFITFIFHYVLVEKYFRALINNEMTHIEEVYNIQNEQFFNQSCQLQHYVCTYQGGLNTIKNQLDSHFEQQLSPYLKQQLIKGNFSMSVSDFKIYLLISNQNKWVINTELAGKSFFFTEQWVMFCLSFAHGFWLFFYIWLLLFHNRRLFKNNTKTNF